VSWAITYYSESVQDDILTLPTGLLARYLRYADRMEIYGPDLGMPHTRAMGDGLFELRLKAAEGIARILYCTIIKQEIMVLHHFIKKSEKTPLRELSLARQRMKEVKHVNTQRT
jgi:phage-related protein